jgi:hypothetical protein
MSQSKLLKRVIQVLEDNRIPYMVTGSVASSLQGEPRSTHDIDIVISLQKPFIKKLIEAFPPPDYYLDEMSILEAIKQQNVFNLINVKEGDKIDFWMLTDEAFDQSRFSRKITETVFGVELQVSAPEDTIIAKLRWAKLSGGSEKQFVDALRIYEVQYKKLDLAYLDRWIKKLDLESLWKQLLDKAEFE